jgi:hypothetical protein
VITVKSPALPSQLSFFKLNRRQSALFRRQTKQVLKGAYPQALTPLFIYSVQLGGVCLLQGLQVMFAGSSLLVRLAQSLLPIWGFSHLVGHGAQRHFAGPQLTARNPAILGFSLNWRQKA